MNSEMADRIPIYKSNFVYSLVGKSGQKFIGTDYKSLKRDLKILTKNRTSFVVLLNAEIVQLPEQKWQPETF